MMELTPTYTALQHSSEIQLYPNRYAMPLRLRGPEVVLEIRKRKGSCYNGHCFDRFMFFLPDFGYSIQISYQIRLS